jgi:PIN like domain
VLGRVLKIRLDENIANRIALAVMKIAENRAGFEVSFVRHGEGKPDPDWIKSFANDGGTAIVSGDHDILQHWPNLIAYTESGLISFFPPKAYQELKAFGRAAFIIRWWPAIIEKIKISKPGDRWRLPLNWSSIDHTKMEPIKDPRIDDKKTPEPTDTTKAIQDVLDLGPPSGGPPERN